MLCVAAFTEFFSVRVRALMIIHHMSPLYYCVCTTFCNASVFCSSASSQSGSGYNRLCLPASPSFGTQHSDANQDAALLYGSTFETTNAGVSGMTSVDNRAVPCAVCEARRGGVIMIPGLLAGILHTAVCCMCALFLL